jgi:hypothetical protein
MLRQSTEPTLSVEQGTGVEDNGTVDDFAEMYGDAVLSEERCAGGRMNGIGRRAAGVPVTTSPLRRFEAEVSSRIRAAEGPAASAGDRG